MHKRLRILLHWNAWTINMTRGSPEGSRAKGLDRGPQEAFYWILEEGARLIDFPRFQAFSDFGQKELVF